MAVYVYAIVGKDHPVRLTGLRGVGEPGAPLRTITTESLRAVVSDTPHAQGHDARNAPVHQEVLTRLMEDGTVLPVCVGRVVPDDAAVRIALENEAEAYRRDLRHVDGCAEYRLQVAQDAEALLRQILEDSYTARKLNDDIRTAAEDPDLPLHLGEMINGEARARHRAFAAGVIEALRPLVRAQASLEPEDDAFFSASFLVPDDRESLFYAAAVSLAQQAGDDFRFRFEGPLPPYSFISRPIADRGA
ncbi:GvpL/GvpF family gas vesicle protein [Streptomyces brasiliensis]|uniref:Gas vesicle protein n=1 Tax=Streptomyces brasiliensis TaxID=1954 RepID=A0A917JZH0_9ACTN|nr:GvpL/GvpF family gas vesicle protein [Streptomyces brasiliensis]GGI93855.1 gas vesicle protein [Streptomyces brasiliensis]